MLSEKKRTRWSKEDDEYLLQIYDSMDNNMPDFWSEVARKMRNPPRNARQCRERFNRYLRPGLDLKREWTEDEDKIIIMAIRKYGHKFEAIAKLFPTLEGRTGETVKNRWKWLSKRVKDCGDHLIIDDPKSSQQKETPTQTEQIEADTPKPEQRMLLNKFPDNPTK